MSAYGETDVTVVMPTYNRRHEAERAIESALAQTVPPDQIIVVDDGSTDGTAEALTQAFGDRIQLLTQENLGPSAARNLGVQAAQTELVAFLDSDDRWMPEKLEQQLPLMEDPAVVLSFTNSVDEAGDGGDLFSANGLKWNGERDLVRDPLALLTRERNSGILLPTCIVRRDAFLQVGGFASHMTVAEDTRLLYRLAFEGPFGVATRPLFSRGYAAAGGPQLTRPDDLEYKRTVAESMLEVVFEAHQRSGETTDEVQDNLRRILASYLTKQSEYFALEGRDADSRTKACEALRYATGKQRWRGWIGRFPFLWRLRERIRGH